MWRSQSLELWRCGGDSAPGLHKTGLPLFPLSDGLVHLSPEEWIALCVFTSCRPPLGAPQETFYVRAGPRLLECSASHSPALRKPQDACTWPEECSLQNHPSTAGDQRQHLLWLYHWVLGLLRPLRKWKAERYKEWVQHIPVGITINSVLRVWDKMKRWIERNAPVPLLCNSDPPPTPSYQLRVGLQWCFQFHRK